MDSSNDYEYHGLLASTWDLLRGDTSTFPDRDFYRDFILEDGQPALDVGCGTGRLLLEYLADGLDVDGVDVSPEMIAICRRKLADQNLDTHLYTQPMERLDLPRKYRTIFVPASSFQLVTAERDAAQALERFLHHLEPGGTLVMSIMTTDSGSEDWYQVGEKIRPEDGKLVRRWERATYDLATRLRHTENRYELVEDGEIVYTEHHVRSPEMITYTLHQIEALLRLGGFEGLQAFSRFTEEPATAEDEVFCIVGRNAR